MSISNFFSRLLNKPQELTKTIHADYKRKIPLSVPPEYWEAASMDSIIEVAACQHTIIHELAALKAFLTHTSFEEVMKTINLDKQERRGMIIEHINVTFDDLPDFFLNE